MSDLIAALLDLVLMLELGTIFLEVLKHFAPEIPKIIDALISALSSPEIISRLSPEIEFDEPLAIVIEPPEIVSLNLELISASLPVAPA